MLKAIGAEGGHVLVVSLQSGGGLRQTCFLRRAAQAVASRGHARSCRRPVRISCPRRDREDLPLPGQPAPGRSRPDGGRRPPGSVSAEPRRNARCPAARDPRQSPNRTHSRGSGRRRAQARNAPVGRGAGGGPLFVHALAKRPCRTTTRPPEETRRFTMLRARSFLRAASVLLAAGGCLFGGVTLLEGVITGGYGRALALQAALYEDRYRKARATLPPAPAEPDEIARVVSVASALRARRGDPGDLLALVSGALAVFPGVRIESVSWRMSDDAEAEISTDRRPGGPDGPGRPSRAGDDRADPDPSGGAPRRDGTSVSPRPRQRTDRALRRRLPRRDRYDPPLRPARWPHPPVSSMSGSWPFR